MSNSPVAPLPLPIGILGGTFDPIHNGHLHIASTVLQQLNLSQIKLIPCYTPVHRPQPQASVADRLAMLELAIKSYPHCNIDYREIERKGASYTIDTLISLREEAPETPLCLILGADAYLGIETWQKWSEIIKLAHIIVISRPAFMVPKTHVLDKHCTNSSDNLKNTTAGCIYILEIPPITISGTDIRKRLKQNQDISTLVPFDVMKYIEQHKLYR